VSDGAAPKPMKSGAKAVRFDADDTDPFLWSALHKLADPIEVFETFELS
jgi:predicted DNA-binding transcriptional regulator AlpA